MNKYVLWKILAKNGFLKDQSGMYGYEFTFYAFKNIDGHTVFFHFRYDPNGFWVANIENYELTLDAGFDKVIKEMIKHKYKDDTDNGIKGILNKISESMQVALNVNKNQK